jgi:CRISPR-associated protein Cmr6
MKKLLGNNALAIPSNMINLQDYNNYLQRIHSLYKNLRMQKYHCQSYEGKVIWRLVIGLGQESIYETSITLHRNYSVPFIPGSAVKGITYHYAKEYKNLPATEIAEIFGDQNNKGKVIFFDALPIIEQDTNFIVLDVMNVHYKPYYEKGEAPGDWHSPNPIFFLAVEKGIKFRFLLASKNKNLVEKATELMREALENIGIGAKTSAGYGYFRGSVE